MEAFRLRFAQWGERPDLFYAYGPTFHVYMPHDDHLVRSIHVLLARADSAVIKHQLGLQDDQDDGPFHRVLLRYAIRRIEQGLRDDLFPTPPSATTDPLWIDREDIPFLQQLLQGKTCAYQQRAGRDLLCMAAAPQDTTIWGTIDFRAVAPTSRALCAACALPDTDYVCSHLLHPQVTTIKSDFGTTRRRLSQALCDRGKPDIGRPERCHAGGHTCWERLSAPPQEHAAIPLAPLDLPEALDFLDTAWRLAFNKKQGLLQLRDTASSAQLALPCLTREDFKAKLSALVDIFKAMNIPDGLLSRTAQEETKGKTFDRLLACLQTRLEETDYQEVEQAVRRLRAVNAIRNGLQHSGAAWELPRAFATLGIPYPLPWGDAWDRIRTGTIEALRIIREKVQRYATASP